jgi:hypothetical protein
MKLDLFADGIANLSISAGVVRIDFYVVRPKGQQVTEGGAGEVERDIHLSVNLPLPGFVGSINILQRVLNELIQRGVVSTGQSPAKTTPQEG